MGTAVKVNGADFSAHSIGKITFKPSIYERTAAIVDSYISAIGGDTTYKAQIYDLVFSLIDNNLWDNIYILYPMLGSTLVHKLVNLKDVSESAAVDSSADISTNGVVFTQSSAAYSPTQSIDVIGGNGLTVFASIKRSSSGYNAAVFHTIPMNKLAFDADHMFAIKTALYSGQRAVFVGASAGGDTNRMVAKSFAATTDAKVILSYHITNDFVEQLYDNDNNLYNHTLVQDSDHEITSESTMIINNYIGNGIHSGDYSWSGDGYMFAVGKIPDNKFATFNTIMRAFESSVK